MSWPQGVKPWLHVQALIVMRTNVRVRVNTYAYTFIYTFYLIYLYIT